MFYGQAVFLQCSKLLSHCHSCALTQQPSRCRFFIPWQPRATAAPPPRGRCDCRALCRRAQWRSSTARGSCNTRARKRPPRLLATVSDWPLIAAPAAGGCGCARRCQKERPNLCEDSHGLVALTSAPSCGYLRPSPKMDTFRAALAWGCAALAHDWQIVG